MIISRLGESEEKQGDNVGYKRKSHS